MPRIQFPIEKNIASFEVPEGANLMIALLENKRPVASSCLGKGICSKCRIRIIEGHKNLSPESEASKGLRERNRIDDEFRISCQTSVLGDITVDTSYW